jgi:hypothetical protein
VCLAIEDVDGTIATEARFEKSTVSMAGFAELTPCSVAVIVFTPTLFPIANPLPLVMNGGKEVHVAELVTSCVDISLKVALAENCS